MIITDAQIHIWPQVSPERPWRPGQMPPSEAPFGVDEARLAMKSAGVARTILIPPYCDGDPDDPVMETRNDYVLAAAQRYPQEFGVMARLKASAPAAADLVANLRQTPGMLGLRCSFTRPDQIAALQDGKVDRLWDAAERARVPVMTIAPHRLLFLIGAVAERHPGLRLIISHLALTNDEYDDHAFRDFDQLLALARYPNVAVKASALPAYTHHPYPYRNLHPYLRRVYDAFGQKRMFWGSDLARLPCTYRRSVTMFTEEIPWLSADDKKWIMGRGLCEWLGWSGADSV